MEGRGPRAEGARRGKAGSGRVEREGREETGEGKETALAERAEGTTTERGGGGGGERTEAEEEELEAETRTGGGQQGEKA